MRQRILRWLPAILGIVVALGACDGGSGDANVPPDLQLPDRLPAPSDTPAFDDSLPLPPQPSPAETTAIAPERQCDPNYTPCVPVDGDVDCAGGRGNGPSYVAGPVRVTGHDVYRLDADRDGIGCEG